MAVFFLIKLNLVAWFTNKDIFDLFSSAFGPWRNDFWEFLEFILFVCSASSYRKSSYPTSVFQIVSSASTDLQDYTYYFVPAPWLSCKLLRLLQCYPPPEDGAVKGRLVECLETILNKAQEPPKSKKVQHSNAKNAILFEAISLIIHYDRWVFWATTSLQTKRS